MLAEETIKAEFEEKYPPPSHTFFECGSYRGWPGDADEDQLSRYQDLWSAFLDGVNFGSEHG